MLNNKFSTLTHEKEIPPPKNFDQNFGCSAVKNIKTQSIYIEKILEEKEICVWSSQSESFISQYIFLLNYSNSR
jgi:hypothetical protein